MSIPPKGVRNNNPGNLRFANQTGAVKTADNFARFDTYDQGVSALDNQLLLYYTGKSRAAGNIPRTTIREIITLYAPGSENQTSSYISTVASRMELDPDETIPINRLPNLREEIVRVELGEVNGQQLTTSTGRDLSRAYNNADSSPLPEDTIEQAITPAVAGRADAGRRETEAVARAGGSATNGGANPNSTNQVFPKFKDNPLADLDNPSYYIRFFVIGEKDERSIPADDPTFASIRDVNKVVLAETAVTGINIESLELKTAVGPNQATKLVQALEFKMRIFEPMGLTFYDKLLAAARDLAIINFQKAPYYIEIKFHGYNPDGSYADNVGPDGPNTKRWVYKVFIVDIQSEFTKAGTVYDITLVQSNDLGTGDNFFALDSSYSMEGATVGDVMRNLIEHKAKSEVANYGIQRNKYTIKLLPLETNLGDISASRLGIGTDPERWAIINPSNTSSSDTTSTNTAGQGSATFAKGNTIATIIEQIFTSTLEGHKLVIRNTQPEIYGSVSQFIIVPWILTSVKIREEQPIYDLAIQDYNRDITYYVIPYLTTQATASIDQQLPIQLKQRNQMIENLKIRVRTGKLEKKYDYLFTGENTEVLNVDFKFDTFFKAVIPLYAGTTNNSRYRAGQQLSDEGGVLQQTIENTAALQKATFDRNRLLNTPEGEKIDPSLRRAAIAEATKRIEDSRARVEDLSIKSSVILQETARRNRENIISGDTFAEDLSSFTGNIFPVTIDKSVRESGQDGAGNIEANAIQQSMTTAVLNQVKDRAMVTVNLEIRGDPYWLGVTNLEESFYQQSNKKTGLATFNDGNMYFILKTLIPQGIEELKADQSNAATAGNVKLSVNEAFTGLYLIKFVLHKFNKGSFTQTLEAVRDVNIDINLIGGLNG